LNANRPIVDVRPMYQLVTRLYSHFSDHLILQWLVGSIFSLSPKIPFTTLWLIINHNICFRLLLFSDHNISQGSVATPASCGGTLKADFTANLLTILSVQVLWKLVSNWRSYRVWCPSFIGSQSIIFIHHNGRWKNHKAGFSAITGKEKKTRWNKLTKLNYYTQKKHTVHISTVIATCSLISRLLGLPSNNL